jgi:hypothetical protein
LGRATPRCIFKRSAVLPVESLEPSLITKKDVIEREVHRLEERADR